MTGATAESGTVGGWGEQATLALTSANTNGVPWLRITSGDFAIQTLVETCNGLVLTLRR